jgi:hypothetical protein
MSNCQLTKAESVILGLGYKFLPRYRRSSDSILHSLRSSLHKFQRRLKWRLHFAFNNNNNNNNSNSNNNNYMIPKIENNNSLPIYTKDTEEYLNLVDDYIVECNNRIDKLEPKSVISRIDQFILNTIVSIKNRKDIVIKPADKNLGLVVMSVEDYSAMCYKILDDKNTYLKISNSSVINDSSPKYIDSAYTKLVNILSEHGYLYSPFNNDQLTPLATSLLQMKMSTNLRPSKFYCLPKMHKSPTAGRPIVSSINSITYHTSKYLQNKLFPVVKRIQTVSLSPRDVIKDLLSLQIPPNSYIVCADVKSLYPSIPREYGIQAVDRLYASCFSTLLTR